MKNLFNKIFLFFKKQTNQFLEHYILNRKKVGIFTIGSESVIQETDLHPYKNETDPQNCCKY